MYVCFMEFYYFRSFCTSFEMIRNQFGESYSSLQCETIIASFSGIFCRFALFSMGLFRNDEVIRILNCLTIFSHQFISNFKWFRKSMRMVILLSFSSISNFCLSISVCVCVFFFETRYFVEPVFLFTSISFACRIKCWSMYIARYLIVAVAFAVFHFVVLHFTFKMHTSINQTIVTFCSL